MQSILTFIIVFGILVIVHEFGHYIVAKKSGVLVREFSVGFGPKLFSSSGNETTYTLRLLPLGGYVRLAGYEEESDLNPGMQVTLVLSEDNTVDVINTSSEYNANAGVAIEITNFDLFDDMYITGRMPGYSDLQTYKVSPTAKIVEEDGTIVQVAPRDRQIQEAPIFKRMLINIAGPLNNVILAIIAFIIVAFMQGGVVVDQPVLGEIQADSPAAAAGLQAGDRVTSIEGVQPNSWTEIQANIQPHPGEELEITVERGGESVTTNVTPATETTADNQEYGLIGVMAPLDTSFWSKVAYGFSYTWQLLVALIAAIWNMISGGFSLDNLGGPVAIYAMTSQAASGGLVTIMNWMGSLSMNLAVINMIPIPALDGGKILFNIIEAIRGKPVSEKVENIVTLVAIVFLFALVIAVTWNDIQRFIIN